MDLLERKWTLDKAVDSNRILGIRLGHQDPIDVPGYESVEVVPAEQIAGAVEAADKLRSEIEQLTMDRDSWKRLAGELADARDAAAGGQS